MASVQALKETSYVHTLSAKECTYKATGGEWREPSETIPSAKLDKATTFGITGKASLELKMLKTLTFEFEIMIQSGIVPTPGMEDANVEIMCKLGDFTVIVQNVQDQILKVNPNSKAWIRATFPAAISPAPSKTLEFSLEHTNPPTMLGSLTFYQVKVIETGI